LSRNVNKIPKTQGGETPPLRGVTLGQVVGYFKFQSTKHINQQRNTPGLPLWQRNYYERVIRDEPELHAIRQYIIDNPVKWTEDENHPTRLSS
jgi:REP element-mobilizing transposase RayT